MRVPSILPVLAAFLCGGCAESAGVPGASDKGETMAGFSWVVDSRLAGMARPGSRRALEEDLQFLEDQEIELLFSLTETAVDGTAAAAHSIEVVHLPVADFTAPTFEQLEAFVRRARAEIAEEHAVGVHCGAGKGRTGTFLAAYFVADGMTAEQAIVHVRRLRPGSVETAAQEQSIAQFAERFVLAPEQRLPARDRP